MIRFAQMVVTAACHAGTTGQYPTSGACTSIAPISPGAGNCTAAHRTCFNDATRTSTRPFCVVAPVHSGDKNADKQATSGYDCWLHIQNQQLGAEQTESDGDDLVDPC
jgi:hypothetical protein